MKSVYGYVIVDKLSESVIYTFYAPNPRMAKKTFEQFCMETKKKAGDPEIVSQFYMCECTGAISIPEAFFETKDLTVGCDGDEFIMIEGDDCEVVSDV